NGKPEGSYTTCEELSTQVGLEINAALQKSPFEVFMAAFNKRLADHKAAQKAASAHHALVQRKTTSRRERFASVVVVNDSDSE
ncbi:hypothetical protein FRC06_008147, partial [Ceratobasidium sp. 370]